MAKATNPAMGKRFDELTDEEREQEEQKHLAKHAELDNMIAAYRKKAERMERINPIVQDEYVLTPEEVEDIEKDLPEQFDDTHIEKELKKRNIDVPARKAKARKEREDFKKMIDEQAKKDNE